jgi:hypothetical protein
MGFAGYCGSSPCPSRHTECPKGLVARHPAQRSARDGHIDLIIAETIAASLRCSRANGISLPR